MRLLVITIVAASLAGCAAASVVHEVKQQCLSEYQLNAWARVRRPDPCAIVAGTSVRGNGTVVGIEEKRSRIILDHEEIPGQMAAMVMGYPVTPVKLLEGLAPGRKVRFTIDADRQAIVNISATEQ